MIRYREAPPTLGQTLQRSKGNDPVAWQDRLLAVVVASAVLVSR